MPEKYKPIYVGVEHLTAARRELISWISENGVAGQTLAIELIPRQVKAIEDYWNSQTERLLDYLGKNGIYSE